MNKTVLFKLALVAGLTVGGLGLAPPAKAALQPCGGSFCAENPTSYCFCESDCKSYRCNAAPSNCSL